MTNDYLIHEYLDTGLDEKGEATLFAALASDPLLRREFARQLKLKNVIEEEARRVTPPAALAGNIFGQLGYTLPAGLATTATAVPFLHKLFPVLGSLASLAFLAFLAVSTTSDSDNSGEPDYIFTQNNPTELQSISATGQTNLAQQELSAYSQNSERGSSQSLNQLASVYSDSLALLKTRFAELQQEVTERDRQLRNLQASLNGERQDNLRLEQSIAAMERAKQSGSQESNRPADRKSSTDNISFNLTFEDILKDNPESMLNGDIEFIPMLAESVKKRLNERMSSPEYQNSIRNSGDELDSDSRENFDTADANSDAPITDNGVYTAELPPYTEPVFGDMFVTVQYVSTVSNPDISLNSEMPSLQSTVGMHLNGYFSVVLNAGMENYGQSFNTMQNGRMIIRNQEPTVYFGTLGARANTSYFLRSFRLFGQASGGYSSFGPMLRANSGIEYRTNELISVILSGEWSYLNYTVDNDPYNSSNTGISIGLVFHP